MSQSSFCVVLEEKRKKLLRDSHFLSHNQALFITMNPSILLCSEIWDLPARQPLTTAIISRAFKDEDNFSQDRMGQIICRKVFTHKERQALNVKLVGFLANCAGGQKFQILLIIVLKFFING